MTSPNSTTDLDSGVDVEILDGLSLESPRSFFLFAGAGSGKTRSLVNVLKRLQADRGKHLELRGQRVGVITYTNAACDEIIHRLGYDDLFSVSTIHSFIWDFIQPFQHDIREWLRSNLNLEIEDLKQQQLKSKSTANKTYTERDIKIKSKEKRLGSLDAILKFSYSPNGNNRGRDALNHSEVISIGAYFLSTTLLAKKILALKYPILLIDESQDTNKVLMDAFFSIQSALPSSFALGLLGDTMQRIYSDGKTNLGQNLPSDWAKPEKTMNHRCPKRVIRLINRIRKDVDGIEQIPRTEKEVGFARIFLVPQNRGDKNQIETAIAEKMAGISGDDLWKGGDSQLKILTLEHHMAANRMGFLPFYEPLQKIERLKTSLLDGTLSGIQVLTKNVLPLINSHLIGDAFGVAQIVRECSPLFSQKMLLTSGNQMQHFEVVKKCVNDLTSLWSNNQDPKLFSIIKVIHDSGLFEIHDSILPILTVPHITGTAEESSNDEEIEAWRSSFDCPFSMIVKYDEYVSNKARFGTHQGVKGLEFDRVLVVLDDEEAKGFMFSYEKLFGVKEKTKADLTNEAEGKETGIDRTRRLFYVTCSRAKKSLAVVAYTESVEVVKRFVLENGWFEENEIIDMSP